MRLLFVRHAEPDYQNDSITPKGRIEAELLSQRLSRLIVKEFYCSPLGRARETAQYTLEKVKRDAQILPWLAEFRGRLADPDTGKDRIPWDFLPRQWAEDPTFGRRVLSDAHVAGIFKESITGIDSLLALHGYHKDGAVYRCENNQPDTLVFFCHFGITMALMSHLCHAMPLEMWHCFCMLPSSVTMLISEERTKGEVYFRCAQLGDISHLYAGGEPPSMMGMFPECYAQ